MKIDQFKKIFRIKIYNKNKLNLNALVYKFPSLFKYNNEDSVFPWFE